MKAILGQAAARRDDERAAAPSGAVEYLGPATVLWVEGLRAGLLVEGREVEARLALAQLYRPEAGDTVLALGGREYYVVGVLAGAGRMVVNAPGDLELRARGAVEIHGARGVRLRGPEVALTADRFTIAVRTVVERAARVYRAATELLHVRARRTRTVVDEECALAAREITARAGADLKLDGEKIHLG